MTTTAETPKTRSEVGRRRWSLLDARLAPFVFLLPFMLVFLVFRIWPLIQAVEMSFQNVQGLAGNDWVGLENYQGILENPQFMKAMVEHVRLHVMTLIILIPIPLALAALLDRGRTYRPLAWRIAMFIPALASLVVVSFLFRAILVGERPAELRAQRHGFATPSPG